MRCKSFLFFGTFLSLIHAPVYAGYSAEDHVAAMVKLIQYQEQHSNAIWSGFHMNKYPIIMQFADLSAPAYAFQFTPQNLEWKSTQIQGMQIYYRDRTFYNIEMSATNFLMVEDQNTLIFSGFSIYNPTRYSHDAIPSLFKEYMRNGSHFPTASFDYGAYTYTGFNNMENVALSKVEQESISDYLKKNDVESLKNYLAVHQARMKLLNNEDIKFEQALELGRGTPLYVRMKTFAKSDGEYVKEALVYYPKDHDYCASFTDKYYIERCLTGSHYSFIDLAAGYALDKTAKSDWKTEVETQGKSFTTVLTENFPMDKNEIDARVQTTKNLYGYESKLAAIQATMKDYLVDMQAQLSTYQQLSGVDVSIEKTGCGILRGARYDKTYSLNSKANLYTNYQAFNLCDGDKYRMSLNYDYIPYRFSKEEHNADHSITEMDMMKLSNDTLLVVNDRQETIGSFVQAGKKEKFNRLLIENNQFMVRIVGLEGTLDGSNHALRMTLDKTDVAKVKHIN